MNNVFANGLTVAGGETIVNRNMTIGDAGFRFLTVRSMAVFTGDLRIESDNVYFPTNSIDATCIKNLSATLNLSEENTWTALQTFSGGLSVTSGDVSITRDTIIGANSNRTLTVNASPTFNSGLKVSSGKISIPDNSLPISAVKELSTTLDDMTTVHNNLYGYVMNVLRIIPVVSP
jgi:hypothetical protein